MKVFSKANIKKTRRGLTSLILVMSMILVFAVSAIPVSAASRAELNDYWYAYYSGDAATAEISTDRAYTGAKSLYVQKNSGILAMYVQNLSDELEGGVKYKVEFYLYNNGGNIDGNVLFYVSDNGKGIHDITTAATDKEGWTKYSHEWTNTVNSNGSGFWFQFNKNAVANFYIDDVKVYKSSDETQTNVINDPGFESTPTSDETVSTIDGFRVQYATPASISPAVTSTVQRTSVYDVSIDSETYMDGNASLYIKRSDHYTERAPQTKLISNEANKYTAGTNYTLSFYTDKQFDTAVLNRSYFYMGTGNNVWLKNMTCELQENGWYKYSYTQAATNQTNLQFMLRGYMDIHIDNLSVTAAGSNVNLAPSGVFDLPEPPSAASYEPKNVIINSYARGDSGAAMILSWRNPEGTAGISAINIYDITDGTETALDNSKVNLAGKAVNEFYLGSYDVATVHTFKLVFTFADGETRQVVCQNKATDYSSMIVRHIGKDLGWIKYYMNSTGSGQNKYMLPAYFNIDNNVYYGESGKSYHLSVNKASDSSKATRPSDWTSTAYYARTYFFSNSNGMKCTDIGTTYRIKFMAKGDLTTTPSANNILLKIQEEKKSGDNKSVAIFSDYVGQTFDWTEFTTDFTTNADSANTYCRLLFHIDDAVDDLWIDNVQCYKLDKNGKEITDTNYVTYGDFDNPSPAVNVSSISGEAGNAKVDISYNAGNATKVYIYEKADDDLYLRAIADPAASSITIDGLKNNKEYEFVYVTENTRAVLSDAISLGKFTPAPPAYEVTDYELYYGGEQVSSITEAGNYTVKVTVKNNAMGSGFTAELIAALYDGYRLVDVQRQMKTVAQTGDGAAFTEYSVIITVPQAEEGTEYSIKTFVWDSYDSMSPLRTADEFPTAA